MIHTLKQIAKDVMEGKSIISEEELKAEAEKSKAIKEALIRVKKSSIERENRTMDSSGADSFKKRLDDRKFLEKLENTDFKFGV